MKSRKIAVTIWGEIKGDIKEYYFETKAMMSGLGYEITHLGIETTNLSRCMRTDTNSTYLQTMKVVSNKYLLKNGQ